MRARLTGARPGAGALCSAQQHYVCGEAGGARRARGGFRPPRSTVQHSAEKARCIHCARLAVARAVHKRRRVAGALGPTVCVMATAEDRPRVRHKTQIGSEQNCLAGGASRPMRAENDCAAPPAVPYNTFRALFFLGGGCR